MNDTEKRQAGKQQAKAAPNKPAAANAPPRKVKRAPPISPEAQTAAKPPEQQVAKPSTAMVVQQPKQRLSTLMSTTALDGFSGFTEEVEGDTRSQGGGIIQGRILKFTNPGCIWVTSDDGQKVPAGLELIASDMARVVEKWIDGMPVREETIVVPPGQKFPNVKAMNEAAPKSEWREYHGEMVGPWQMQYLVYLLNAHTLDKFTYPTSTIGGGMCCREFADKVAWMRGYKGPNVHAVVTLSDVVWITSHGRRQRPRLQIMRWIGFDGAGDKTLSGSQPALDGGAAAKPEMLPLNEVKEPTLAEEMGDAVPDYDDDVSNI
jgi:hypothetical protein